MKMFGRVPPRNVFFQKRKRLAESLLEMFSVKKENKKENVWPSPSSKRFLSKKKTFGRVPPRNVFFQKRKQKRKRLAESLFEMFSFKKENKKENVWPSPSSKCFLSKKKTKKKTFGRVPPRNVFFQKRKQKRKRL